MSFLPTPFDCCTCGTSAATGGGAVQVISGAFDDPNGNVEPDNLNGAAIYYVDSATINEWKWSIGDQVWYQVLAS